MSTLLLVQENVITELCMLLVEDCSVVSQVLAKTKLLFLSYKDSKHVLGIFHFLNNLKRNL